MGEGWHLRSSSQAEKTIFLFYFSIFSRPWGIECRPSILGRHFSLLSPQLQMPVSLKHTLQTHSGINFNSGVLHLQPSGHRISISYSDNGLWITETKREEWTATGRFLRLDGANFRHCSRKESFLYEEVNVRRLKHNGSEWEGHQTDVMSSEGQVRDSGQPCVLLRMKYTKHLIQAMWKG